MVRYYCPNSDFRCQFACYGPNHTSKRQAGVFCFLPKVVFTKDIYILNVAKAFEIWFFAILKYVKIPKMVKM